VDEYIAASSQNVRDILEKLRRTIQFPIDQPIPFELIKKIVRYRVKENLTERNNAQA
jgi:uncharacterized protein YdhG (YjbR/CyaY superfamily)